MDEYLSEREQIDQVRSWAKENAPWALAGILIGVGALLGWQQWQAWQQQLDIEETDAAILTSDLPIDAYLDHGFQAWLKHAGDDD